MTFKIWRAWTLRGRRWFWHLRARNGRIVASGESSGFHNLGDVKDIIEKIIALDAAKMEIIQ